MSVRSIRCAVSALILVAFAGQARAEEYVYDLLLPANQGSSNTKFLVAGSIVLPPLAANDGNPSRAIWGVPALNGETYRFDYTVANGSGAAGSGAANDVTFTAFRLFDTAPPTSFVVSLNGATPLTGSFTYSVPSRASNSSRIWLTGADVVLSSFTMTASRPLPLTGGTVSAGVPGPVAGAGLAPLAAAGAWMLHHRKRRRRTRDALAV